MATPEEAISASALYADFMDEIKTRVGAITTSQRRVQEDTNAPDAFLHAEFCFLQIRFVCELMALAVAAAHHPAGLTKDILKAWHADRALGYLADLNPICFQRPVRFERKPDGTAHFEILEAGALTLEELRAIYNKCGEVLHRGSLKHALSKKERIYDLQSLNEWTRSIAELLTEHTILIPSEGIVLMVQMGKPGAPVNVITAMTEDGGQFAYTPQGAAKATPDPTPLD